MSEKVLYPIFGSQSIGAVMEHLKDFNMTFDAKYKLASELIKRFKMVQYKITFDPKTGAVENVEPLVL